MKKTLLLTGMLLGLGCACLAQSQPQSLAELARQKKPAKKAVMVLNDDDFSRSTGPVDDTGDSGPAAPGTSSESAAKPGPGKTNAAGGKKDKDAPVSKDQRTNELQQKLASYQKEEQAWNKSAKHYEDLLASESDDFRRQTYQDSLENDKHNAALYQQKIDEVQNQLSKQKSSQDSGHADSAKPDGGSQP